MAVSGILAEIFAELSACRHLFLRQINEPHENSLRLLVEEGTVSPEASSMRIGGTVIADAHRIVCNENTGLFEVSWKSYICYSVRNESYVMRDETEKYELGNLIRLYSDSKFLDFVRSATFACNEYPGPFQHVQVITEMHIIDVISTAAPAVRKLRPILRA